MSMISAMTTIPIATQTPMSAIFGQRACQYFWTTTQIYTWKMATSGMGMAVYRFLCYQYLFKRKLNTKSMARKILLVEWLLIAGMILSTVTCYNMFGWEKAVYYQFCMDIGHDQVETLHQHKIEDYNDLVWKFIFAFLGFTGRFCMLLELVIYFWLIYRLWKQDEENYKDKVITDDTRKERKHKNVVTLRGQVLTFVIEMSCSIYIAIHNSDPAFVDASTKSISLVICSTIISVVQILTSNEMMRFVRGHLP